MSKPTLMQNNAAKFTARTPLIKTKRSAFPVNFSNKFTCKASYLYPVLFEEVLPGDTWDIDLTQFIRLMPQVTAPMDNLWVKFYAFYRPRRLAWENFTKQHGERENPEDDIDYITPSITYENGIPFKSLADYLGGTRCGINNTKMTSYGHRMYNNIWNDYFRASEIQDKVFENKTDTDDDPDNYKLLRVCKMHDGYFTDALPSILSGGLNSITLPLGTECPIIGNNGNISITNGADGNNAYLGIYDGTTQTTLWNGTSPSFSANGTLNTAVLKADLSNSVAATLSALRMAIDSMELLERDQRSGNRYNEIMFGRYSVVIPDLTLQRAQLVGSVSYPLFTTPVIQTSGTGTTGQNTPQGNVAGIGVGGQQGNIIRFSSVEFGDVMVLMCIQAMPQYQQGLDKKYSRYERYDYYYPEFNGMTDQTITKGEIFYTDPETVNDNGEEVNNEPWAYIPKYEELRTFKNKICGELRSEYTQTLDSWHYAEKFETQPLLNSDFLEDKTAEILQRSLAVTSESDTEDNIAEQFLCDINFRGSVVRGIPVKAQPRTGGNILI